MMEESIDVLVAGESFSTTVKGDDVIECRARAWDELQKILGSEAAAKSLAEIEPVEPEADGGLDVDVAERTPLRDPVGIWIAVQMAHAPNPDRVKQREDGSMYVDEEEPRLVCSVVFGRATPGRPTFA